VNWDDLVPSYIAQQQKAWERAQRVKWAYESTPDLTLKGLGKCLGISSEGVRKILCHAHWYPVSPVVLWVKVSEHAMAYEIAHGPMKRAKVEDRIRQLRKAGNFSDAQMLHDLMLELKGGRHGRI
jgi:hypothetical protein